MAAVRTHAMTGHLLLKTSRNAPVCSASAAVRCELSCCIIPFPTNGRAVNGGASTACIMPACNACVIRRESRLPPSGGGRTRTSLLVAGGKRLHRRACHCPVPAPSLSAQGARQRTRATHGFSAVGAFVARDSRPQGFLKGPGNIRPAARN